jgi:hypothetical protein
MPRCHHITHLQVYHLVADQGETLNNALVLCRECFFMMPQGSEEFEAQHPFPYVVQDLAWIRSRYQCECASPTCSHILG